VLKTPSIDGLITFLYFNDLEKADRFYQEVLGLELTIDQGFAKIFRLQGGSYIGLVDGKKGSLKPSNDKPVMVTLLVPDVDAWYQHLTKHGVQTRSPPKDDPQTKTRYFMFQDPEGYILEIQRFY
jgi:lactoylglutathione lyase